MIFNVENTCRAKVFDVDSMQEIKYVLEVDTNTNTLLVFTGGTFGSELANKAVAYRSIYPIYGELVFPQLFHCYGRIDES